MVDLSFNDASHGDQRGGITRIIDVTPTVTAGAYAAGQAVGGTLTLTNAARHPSGSGIIHSLAVCCDGVLNADMDIALFDSDPSGSTTTDNGAADIVAADIPKCFGVIALRSSTDNADLGTADVLSKAGLNIPFNIPADVRDLYAVAIARAAFTPGATDALTFRFGILQD